MLRPDNRHNDIFLNRRQCNTFRLFPPLFLNSCDSYFQMKSAMLFFLVEIMKNNIFGASNFALIQVIPIDGIIKQFSHQFLLMAIFVFLNRLQLFFFTVHYHHFIVFVLEEALSVGFLCRTNA